MPSASARTGSETATGAFAAPVNPSGALFVQTGGIGSDSTPFMQGLVLRPLTLRFQFHIMLWKAVTDEYRRGQTCNPSTGNVTDLALPRSCVLTTRFARCRIVFVPVPGRNSLRNDSLIVLSQR